MNESFIIQSDISNLTLVEERLFHFCQECHVGDSFSVVLMATRHAVENAIVHGNGNDSTKSVQVSLGTCRGGIFVEVSDEGCGFDYGQYGDLPLDDEMSGNGIFVMQSLADEIEFLDGGSRVRLQFKVCGIAPTDAMERICTLKEHFSRVEV